MLGFGFQVLAGVGFMLGFGFQAWLLGLKPMGFGFRPPPVKPMKGAKGISRRVRGGYPQAYKAYGGGIRVLVLMKVISQRSVELEEHDPVLSAKSYKRAAREPVSHRNLSIEISNRSP